MGTATPSPLVAGRPLRVAHVDSAELARLGLMSMLESVGGHELVLSVATGVELLRALDGGTLVDVVIVRMNARDHESDRLLHEVRTRHPGVRTVACLEEPEQALAQRAYRARACHIVSLAELDEDRLRIVLAELRQPGERGLDIQPQAAHYAQQPGVLQVHTTAMNDPATPYSPTEKEVLELVDYHILHMRMQEHAGLHDPENAGKMDELQRIAALVEKRASNRQEKAVASVPDDLPGSLEEKLKLLKDLELTLTTVQPDGTTLAERIGDGTGAGDALRESAALYKRLTADLEKQRKLEQVADEQLEAVRDMLLLWKMNNSTLLGPTGVA